jgi:hypothetical protein
MTHPPTIIGRSQPVAAALSPLVIRTVFDIEKLMISPRAAKRLPQGGLVISIPGLNEHARTEFQTQLSTYIRSCGCAAGGATFLIASAVFIAYTVAVALNRRWTDLVRAIPAALIGVMILTVIAKLLGLYVARLRFRRSCASLIRSLSGTSRVHDKGRGFYDV